MLRAVFGARGQLAVGVIVFVVSVVFWAIGTKTIPGAYAPPWKWSPAAFIFHGSMFALVIASYGIVATALGYRATERVEAKVVDELEIGQAEQVDVG